MQKVIKLFAVVLGLTAALLTQSFTPERTSEWGNDEGEPVDLSQYDGRDDDQLLPNTYRCDFHETIICTGTYDGPGTPEDVEELEETATGIFEVNQ